MKTNTPVTDDDMDALFLRAGEPVKFVLARRLLNAPPEDMQRFLLEWPENMRRRGADPEAPEPEPMTANDRQSIHFLRAYDEALRTSEDMKGSRRVAYIALFLGSRGALSSELATDLATEAMKRDGKS